MPYDCWGYHVPVHTLCPSAGWDVGDAHAAMTHQLGISSGASVSTWHPAQGHWEHAAHSVSSSESAWVWTATCPCPQAGNALRSSKLIRATRCRNYHSSPVLTDPALSYHICSFQIINQQNRDPKRLPCAQLTGLCGYCPCTLT